MKRPAILLLMALLASETFSQPTVTFLPVNGYFFTTDQIWNFNIINTSNQPITSNIEVSLLKNGSYPVVIAKLTNYEIKKGLNMISNSNRLLALTSYGNDATSQNFKNTGILPPGNYATCVTITNAINQTIAYSCRELQVSSFSLPVLMTPINDATIYTGYPLLAWLPVVPTNIPGLLYKLELWHSGKGGDYKVSGNLFETTLSENNFQYYPGLPLLETGKTYSWKVAAYSGDFYLGSSDIWEFTVNTTANARVGNEYEDSYRIVSNETENALYSAEDVLRIKYENIANDSVLVYSIYMVDNPDSTITDLPEIQLIRGVNKIDIDLASLETFAIDTFYILEIEDANERKYFLRFLYTEL